jgi:hypothetical protein
MKIDTDAPGTISGFLSISTLGDVASDPVPFSIGICASPLLKIQTTAVSALVKPVYELNENDGSVIIS